MTDKEILVFSSALLRKAKALGADLAGFASVEELKKAPSFTFAPQLRDAWVSSYPAGKGLGLAPGAVAWPENARTIMVVAVHHPENMPEMDWWFGPKDPPGNRALARIVRELCGWISQKYRCHPVHLPYGVEMGGTYLKDAAVHGGLGCIGKNNLVVTPEYGPRIRLRGLALDVPLPATGPTTFDPCSHCAADCRSVCPQETFAEHVHLAAEYGQEHLPGRDGNFSRVVCSRQMVLDEKRAKAQSAGERKVEAQIVRYCRRCEFACPVGQIAGSETP